MENVLTKFGNQSFCLAEFIYVENINSFFDLCAYSHRKILH